MTNSWQEHVSISFISTSANPAAPARQVLLALLSFGSASSLSADSRGTPPTSSGATSHDRPQSHLHQPNARRVRSGRIALPPDRNILLEFARKHYQRVSTRTSRGTSTSHRFPGYTCTARVHGNPMREIQE